MRWLELTLAALVVALPQVAIELVAASATSNRTRLAIAAVSVLMLLGAYGLRSRLCARRLSKRLSEAAAARRRRLRASGSANDPAVPVGVDLVILRDSAGLAPVATELVLGRAQARVLLFAPTTAEQRDLLFARVERAQPRYDRGGRRQHRMPPGLPKAVGVSGLVVELRPRAEETLGQSFDREIEALVDGSGTVSRMLKRRLRSARGGVILLVDLLGHGWEQARAWLRSELPEWCRAAVVAVPASALDRLGDYLGEAAGELIIPGESVAGNVACSLDTEIDRRSRLLAAAFGVSESESSGWFRSLAVSFVRALSTDPESDSFLARDITPTDVPLERAVKHAAPWIEELGSISRRRYRWRREAALERDFLVAVALLQDDVSLSDGIADSLRTDTRFCYVIPFLDWLTSFDGAADSHSLAGGPRTVAQRLIEVAWNPDAKREASLIELLRVAVREGGGDFIDWRDRARLLTAVLEQGGVCVEVAGFFSQVPAAKRLAAIMASDLSGADLASTLTVMASDRERWEYFEANGPLPATVVDRLAAAGRLGSLVRTGLAALLAPHGPVLNDALADELARASGASPAGWGALDALPLLASDQLEQVAVRVLDVCLKMPDQGEAFLRRLGERRQSELATALANTLHGRITGGDT